MTQAKREQDFLSIIRLGIGHAVLILPDNLDWPELKALAEEHGLLGVMIDGIERMPEDIRPPKHLLLEWIGEVLQGYEHRYVCYQSAISELASVYNSNGFKMMVLKGYACSLNWPKPEHRPCGDIDIWLFGKQKEADVLLANIKGIKVDNSHHHHTVFDWDGFMVENHYDFINVHHHKSNVEFEEILKDLGQDNSYTVDIRGEKVYLPSPNLHALFLLKHLMLHFASENITIRQILDWAFYVKTKTNDIDWQWLLNILEKYGMIQMFHIFNAICVEDLGFGANLFPSIQFNPFIKERVLNDILNPEFDEQKPDGILKRILFRFRRWRSNGWKHKLCYNESLWGAFCSGVWNHILKPSSI